MNKFILFIFLSLSYFNFGQNPLKKSVFKEDTIVSSHYLLCILDSINEIRTAKTYSINDSDGYFQIQGDYAVLSYRSRGKNEFSSGKIYQSGRLILNDTLEYTAIRFQADNLFDPTNQGKRYYIAFRKTENNKCEIFLCSNTFVPYHIIVAHNADEHEKKNLIEKSLNKN